MWLANFIQAFPNLETQLLGKVRPIRAGRHFKGILLQPIRREYLWVEREKANLNTVVANGGLIIYSNWYKQLLNKIVYMLQG